MEPFELRDADLLLSPPTAADVDRITACCREPEIQRWTTVPSPYTRADAEQFVTAYVPSSWEQGGATLAVRHDGRLVGMVGLEGAEAGSAEIGYWLAADARGQGLMSRAVGLVLDAGFEHLGLRRVEWRAFVGNWASWRVAWRHGVRREGTVRGLAVQRGARLDSWIGTLLAEDPRTPAAPWDGPTPGERGTGDRPGASPAAPAPRPGSESSMPASEPRTPEALVAEFHTTYGLPVVSGEPDVDRERVHMRLALVAEELAELVEAVYGAGAACEIEAAYTRAVAADDGTRDTVAAADALGDLVYVIYGMALECGIPLPAVLQEIHASNLSKLGADGRPVLRADGKVLKGPGYFPPDVAGVLAARAPVHGTTAQ